MVKTRLRPPAPERLLEKQAEWTERWKSGPRYWATDTAKQTIKDALQPLTHSKCVYCEVRLDWPVGVHIEHYVAKTVEPELAFEWSNLLPACAGCNAAKGNQDHDGSLIKPDNEDPEQLLRYDLVTGRIEPKPDQPPDNSRRVSETVRLCGLHRGDLIERRLHAYKSYLAILHAILELRRRGSPEIAERLESMLLDPQEPFKLVLRTMLWLEGFPDLAAEDRRRFGSHP